MISRSVSLLDSWVFNEWVSVSVYVSYAFSWTFFPSACFVFDVLVFILLYYILFYHFPLEAWFLMRDIKGVNLNGRLYREALGRVEGRETIIMMYHMRTKSLFNKMKNRKNELLKFEEITWDNKNNSIIIIQFQFRYMF